MINQLKENLMLDLVRNKVSGLVTSTKNEIILYTHVTKEIKDKLNTFMYTHYKQGVKQKINIFIEDFSKL